MTYLSNLLRFRWARRRLVDRFLRKFTTRRRADRISHFIP
jgi:hypothetical protein